MRTFRRTITETDLVNFFSVTGMLEAIFIEEDYEGAAMAGRPVPGALTYTLIEGFILQTVMPGFEVGAGQCIMVPANTPKAVVQRLNVEINKALQSAEVKEKLALQGTEPLGSTSEEYGAYVKKELARWAAVVKATGVTLE